MWCNLDKGELLYDKFPFLELKELTYSVSLCCSNYNSILRYLLNRPYCCYDSSVLHRGFCFCLQSGEIILGLSKRHREDLHGYAKVTTNPWASS